VTRSRATLLALVAVALGALLLGCEAGETSRPEARTEIEQAGPEVLPIGGDPDGVGVEVDGDADDVVERVEWPDGRLVLPGDDVPDGAVVWAFYACGRVEKTTWGDIKDQYSGNG